MKLLRSLGSLVFFNLVLAGIFPAQNSRAASLTWSGAGLDDNWSTVDNWAGIAPASGDSLIFDGVTRLVNTNDLTLSGVAGIRFNTGGFVLNGNSIPLTTSAITNSAGTNTLNLGITWGIAGTVYAAPSTELIISGTLTNPFSSGNSNITYKGGGVIRYTGGYLQISNNPASIINSADVIIDGGSYNNAGGLRISSDTGATAAKLILTNGAALNQTIAAGAVRVGDTSGLLGELIIDNSTVTHAGGNISLGFTASSLGAVKQNGGSVSNAVIVFNQAGNTTVSYDMVGGILDAVQLRRNNNTGPTATMSFDASTLRPTLTAVASTFFTNFLTSAEIKSGGLTIETPIDITIAQVFSGAGGILKTGPGALTLSGASTFAGGVTLNQGTLSLGVNNPLGTGTLIINGGIIQPSATTGRSANNAFVVNTNFASAGGANVTLSGAGSLATNISIAVNNANLVLSGVVGEIGGSWGITKTGPGVLQLNGNANTYSGDTIISSGALQLDADGVVGNGAGAIVLAGGTLQSSAARTVATANPLTMTTDAVIATSSSAASATFEFSSSSISGTAGTLTFTNFAASGTFKPRFSAGGFDFNRPIILANGVGSLTELNLFNVDGTEHTFSGDISGNGSINRSNVGIGGNTILSGSNSFSGGITLTRGSIGIGSDYALGTGVMVPNGGGIFASGSARSVTNTFSFSAGLTIGGAADLNISGPLVLGAANRNITVTNSASTTFSGPITSTVTGGSTAMTKLGGSTLLIPNANDYAGDTVVADGTLKVTNPTGSATGTGTVIVTNTGILSGNGTVFAVAAADGGEISPGSSIGTIVVTNATFGPSGVYHTEIADANGAPGAGLDFLDIQGTLAITATASSPFVIDLDSMGVSAANFSNANTYSWVIATATGGVTGFAADKFVVVTTNFLNDIGTGGFGITTDGNNIILNFATPPTITIQPVGSTNLVGANVSFSVAATGTEPLFYQWKKDGVAITDATNTTFSIVGITSADAGSYTATVFNLAGTRLSDAAVIAIAPSITSNPVSSTNSLASSATFSVSAEGQPTLRYQWRHDGIDIAGATDSSYTINAVAGLDAGSYDVVVTNDVGSATSSAATLYVSPQIIAQPQGFTTNGGTASLTVAFAGSPVFDLQWQKDGVNLVDVAGKIEGAVTNASAVSNAVSLVISNLVAADSGDYTVIISNNFGAVTSSIATLSVIEVPEIAVQPQNTTASHGSNATFNVVATGNQLTYQWFFGASPISGATDASLTILNVSDADTNDAYSVVITNVSGSVTSDNAFLAIVDLPVIVAQPANVLTNKGSNATFAVEATGVDLTYQWYFGASPIAGATDSSVTIYNVTAADTASPYSVTVSNAAGAVTSDAASLTLLPETLPIITQQPQTVSTANQGADVEFSVVAEGDSLAYQWQANGSPISGATDSVYTRNNVQPADTSIAFSVVVSNAAGSTNSQNAFILSVIPDSTAPKLTVTTPKKNAGTNSAFISVTGIAKDSGTGNSGIIKSVTLSLNGGPTNSAVISDLGKGSWSFASSPVELTPGLNSVTVFASDLAGNQTSLVVPFYYDTTNTVTLVINGSSSTHVKMGTANTWNVGTSVITTLKVGRTYRFDAYVDSGVTTMVFTNWTTLPNEAGHSTNNWVQKDSLTFVVQSNMVITANFMTNPFTALAGTYNGLFSETAGITHETAGFIQVKVKEKSTFSGYLLFDGVKRPFSGKLKTDGTVSKEVARVKVLPQDAVTLNLAVDLNGETITGTVVGTNNSWTSTILADKAVFSDKSVPAVLDTKYVGSYTFQLPQGNDAPASSPGGVSYGTVSNSPAGIIKLGGLLADGQKLSQKVNISRDGHWPLYVGLYKNASKVLKGSAMGWVNFTTNADFGPSVSNVVTWIKKDGSDAVTMYAAGFSNSVELAGSPYVAPLPGQLPINVNVGDKIIVSDGNLTEPVTNVVIATDLVKGKVTLSKTNTLGVENKASIVFKAKDGTFSGGFLNPALKTKTQGAVLQNTTNATGFFLGTSQSGTIRIEPATP